MKTLHPKGLEARVELCQEKKKRRVMEIWRSHGKGWGDQKHNSC